MEISLKNIFDYLMKGIAFILIVSILFGLGGFLYTKYFVDPTYSASVKFYASGTDTNTSESYARSVAPQFIEFLNVAEFYETVSQDLLAQTGSDISPRSIESCIQFSTVVEDTSTFYATVTGTDAVTVYNVARSVAKLAPDQVGGFENAGVLEVISNPSMPSAPTGPNILKQTILFLLIGFCLSATGVVAKELLDNRIKGPEEITEIFHLPVLGVVPEFGQNDKKGGRS